MVKRLRLGGKNLKISSTIVQRGIKFPHSDPNSWTRHNQFRVKVCDEDEGVCKSFNYHGSHDDWQKNKTRLDDEDLLFALRAFLDDSMSGTMDFEEFCSEFGYECYEPPESTRAKRIHRAVQDANEKANDLGISDDEVYDMFNELSEMGIE